MKQQKKKQCSIPKCAKRLIFGNQTWHYVIGRSNLVIFDPTFKKHILPIYSSSGRSPDKIFLPGDVRSIIEKQILGIDLSDNRTLVNPDDMVEIGKLYVKRDVQPNDGFMIHTSPGTSAKRQYIEEHFKAGLPVIPVKHWVDQGRKTYFFKVILGEKVATLYFDYPRMWGGHFKRIWPKTQ